MLNRDKKTMFKVVSLLLLVFMLYGCQTQDSCLLFEPCITRKTPLSIEETKKLDYPLYLPSSQTVSSLNLQDPPTISLKRYDEVCEYLQMQFSTQDASRGDILINISSGCINKYVISSMYLDELSLSWAEEQRAYLLDNDGTVWLVFNEQTQGIEYEVSSGRTLSETMLFLESMELVSVK